MQAFGRKTQYYLLWSVVSLELWKEASVHPDLTGQPAAASTLKSRDMQKVKLFVFALKPWYVSENRYCITK